MQKLLSRFVSKRDLLSFDIFALSFNPLLSSSSIALVENAQGHFRRTSARARLDLLATLAPLFQSIKLEATLIVIVAPSRPTLRPGLPLAALVVGQHSRPSRRLRMPARS